MVHCLANEIMIDVAGCQYVIVCFYKETRRTCATMDYAAQNWHEDDYHYERVKEMNGDTGPIIERRRRLRFTGRGVGRFANFEQRNNVATDAWVKVQTFMRGHWNENMIITRDGDIRNITIEQFKNEYEA